VATASGVTVRTLHYYEEIGLLVPQRTEAGHRVYSSQEVERLSRICLLRRMGLPLSAVARSIESGGTDLRPMLENYLEDLTARLQATTALRNSIQHFMAATHSSGRDQTDHLFTLLEETAMAETPIERRISVLVYSDIESAYDYLVRVFHLGPGALFRDETGRPVHGELEAGDGVVWLHPELKRARLASPRSLGGSSSTMAVMVENVDTHFENAVKAGAKIEHPPVDQPYGFREYSAWDCEDQLWSFMKALA
jgi:MerR family transcriptional regulator, thiopeptide resistance regulator